MTERLALRVVAVAGAVFHNKICGEKVTRIAILAVHILESDIANISFNLGNIGESTIDIILVVSKI